VQTGADSVTLTARKDGLVLTLAWSLPAGAAPLTCRATLVNELAPAANFQFEGYFLWHRPQEARLQSVLSLPGLAPVMPTPYLEVRYDTGDDASACAAWWQAGTSTGVVLRAQQQIERFFYGLDTDRFVLGPHSTAASLAPGEQLSAEFAIAPLAWAQAQGWDVNTAAAESSLAQERAGRKQRVAMAGTVAEWTSSPMPAFTRRAMHLVRYPASLDDAIRSLEMIAKLWE
jgi:hypothetical protein